jgi:1,4-dihydroxy-2-naphthoate polyprenyltransferase
MKYIRWFIRLSRPLFIISAVLTYLLGISIAHYLTGQVEWNAFFIGLVWVVLVLIGTQFLNEYFDPAVMLINPARKRTPFSGATGAVGSTTLPRPAAFWLGLTCYAIATSFTVIILQNSRLNQSILFLLGVILLGELLFALPPVRLVSSGYGELVMSIINVGLIPAIAFLMQGHDFHRLLAMVVFPLTILYLSMLLALEFPDYAADISREKRSMLIRIGWQRGMLLHNGLILVGFALIALAFVLGLPLNVGWPIILVIPVGLYQVWMMVRIADGAKPNWSLLVLVAISTFGLAAYIFTFAFWTH